MYDVVFGAYVEDQPSVQFTPILHQEMLLITSLNHPLANEKEVPFQVLQDYPVIGYDRDSGLGLYTHKLYRKHQIQPDIVIDCPDEYSIAALVQKTLESHSLPMLTRYAMQRLPKFRLPAKNSSTRSTWLI